MSNYAVGYSDIDVDEATKRGIRVTKTPGVLIDTTADYAFTLMMTISMRIVDADKVHQRRKMNSRVGPKDVHRRRHPQ